jgi:hypothetical protein
MPTSVLAIVGSVVILLWGIAHIVPTRSVVGGFGVLSADNRRIITMEWVAEGLTLAFIGLLALVTTLFGGPGNAGTHIVYWAASAMLLVMAAWTALTGARTSIVPIKICPFVKTAVAIMFILATVL